jgi:hypothetical protein
MLTAQAAAISHLTAENAQLRADLEIRRRAESIVDAQVVLDADRAQRLLAVLKPVVRP